VIILIGIVIERAVGILVSVNIKTFSDGARLSELSSRSSRSFDESLPVGEACIFVVSLHKSDSQNARFTRSPNRTAVSVLGTPPLRICKSGVIWMLGVTAML